MAKKVYIRKKRLNESTVNEDSGGGYERDLLNMMNSLRQGVRSMNEEMEKQTALLRKLLQVFTVYAKKELAAEAEEQKKRDAEKQKNKAGGWDSI